MDTLFLYNTKTLKEKFNTKVFAGDNHITKIAVQIPDNIGGYPKSECEYNLRAIIPEGNLSYMINPSQPYFYITNDITEKAQTVKLMMIITHEGNVIGRTNTVDLIVNEPAEAPDPPLTPREEFDEVIAEQRAEIAEQAETISTQSETITQQSEQITELNGEVTELTTENTNLSNQNETYRQTIQTFIDNPPAPQLETPDPVTPSTIQQTIRPEAPAVGLTAVVVNGIDPIQLGFDPQYYEVGHSFLGIAGTNNTDLQVFLSHDDTVEPFDIECSAGVIYGYLFYQQTRMKNCILTGNPTNIGTSAFYNCKMLEKMVVPSSVIEIYSDAFFGCSALVELTLNQGLQSIGYEAFRDCTAIADVFIPNTVTFISNFAFRDCFSLINLSLPNSINSINGIPFMGNSNMKNVTLENGFNCNNLNLSASILYSHDTILSWFNALADRTGLTAYTLTIGATNIAKMTAEEKAIATNKNWNLA